MYRIGDKIVHPMHGAGVVDEIVTRKVNNVQRDYYSLRMPIGGMLVLIPTDHCQEIGVRSVLSPQEFDAVLTQIRDLQVKLETNWNHRYQENMQRLKSGDLLEVAKVVKSLLLRDTRRGLSTGERKMLHSAKQILVSELSLSCDISYEEAEGRIDQVLHA
jgi:CarD family transcriptional regulator